MGQDNLIHQALEDLNKADLNTLRKMARYPIKSNLKKADLVDALENSFRKDPVSLLSELPVYDLLILSKLCGMPRDTCILCEKYPDMLYSMIYNIIEWDISEDDGNKIELWLTDDMYNLISPFVDKVLKDVETGKRYLIDYFFWGMLWVYGTPTTKDFINVLKKAFGTDEKDWGPIFIDLCNYFPFEDMDIDGTFLNPVILDYDYLQQQKETRGMDRKPVKEYSLEEIIAVGATGPYFHYGRDTKECKDAIAALRKCGFNFNDASARISRLYLDVQEVEEPLKTSEMMQRTIGTPKLKSVDELNSVIQPIMEYMNSVPRWFLGGRSPKDIPVSREAKAQLASMAATAEKMSSMTNFSGVGRNDPCPCGSGLKYKHCHGKYQS